MKQFLTFTLASCLGIFLALGALFFFFFVMILAAASGSQTVQVKDNSVLKLVIPNQVPEKTNNTMAGSFDLEQPDVIGLYDMVRLIEKAADDEKIRGMVIDPSQSNLGLVASAELNRAVEQFRESGKFVICYGNYFSQGSYLLAAAADEIYLNPIGSVDFRGFAAYVPFFKNLLDKTDMKMQIYYAGDFKSATEPFRRTQMSPENKLQTRVYLNEVFENYLDYIAEKRNTSETELRQIVEEFRSKSADDALQLGLVDHIGFWDEAEHWMRGNLGLEGDEKISYIPIQDYYKTGKLKSDSKSRDRIAIVYAEGEIVPGKGDYGVVTDVKYGDIFQKLRKSDRVKGVVLRVNSPGGSILASENILREIKLYQEEGKPLVVSMGDVAASGGYYISATADSIFAEENSLTGSIGVFTLIPNPHAMLDNKLGINFDTVRTGKFSTAFSPYFAWSSEEDAYMQQRTDDFYELFLERVAEGRNMTKEDVHKIAQGRIWSGEKARDLGLVDANGNLDDAVSSAAALAGIEEYRLTEYPRVKNPLDKLIAELAGQEASIKDRFVEYQLKKQFPEFTEFRHMLENKGPMARLPVVLSIR